MSSQARQVLVIGLDPYRVPGPWDPEPVARKIEESAVRLAEHGLDAETCLVGIDGSDDVAVVVTSALRSRPWDVVVVAGGRAMSSSSSSRRSSTDGRG